MVISLLILVIGVNSDIPICNQNSLSDHPFCIPQDYNKVSLWSASESFSTPTIWSRGKHRTLSWDVFIKRTWKYLTVFFHNGNLVFKLKICASNCPFKMKMLDLILFKLLLFKITLRTIKQGILFPVEMFSRHLYYGCIAFQRRNFFIIIVFVCCKWLTH